MTVATRAPQRLTSRSTAVRLLLLCGAIPVIQTRSAVLVSSSSKSLEEICVLWSLERSRVFEGTALTTFVVGLVQTLISHPGPEPWTGALDRGPGPGPWTGALDRGPGPGSLACVRDWSRGVGPGPDVGPHPRVRPFPDTEVESGRDTNCDAGINSSAFKHLSTRI
ncbi:unnamed protein product [Boreogadus saida]